MLFKWLPALETAFLAAHSPKDPIKTRGGGHRVAPFQRTRVLHFPTQRPSLAPVMRQVENAKCGSYLYSRTSARQRFYGSWLFLHHISASRSVVSLSLLHLSCVLFCFYSVFIFLFSPLSPFICSPGFFLASSRQSTRKCWI